MNSIDQYIQNWSVFSVPGPSAAENHCSLFSGATGQVPNPDPQVSQIAAQICEPSGLPPRPPRLLPQKRQARKANRASNIAVQRNLPPTTQPRVETRGRPRTV